MQQRYPKKLKPKEQYEYQIEVIYKPIGSYNHYAKITKEMNSLL